jgi:hypothetical protein
MKAGVCSVTSTVEQYLCFIGIHEKALRVMLSRVSLDHQLQLMPALVRWSVLSAISQRRLAVYVRLKD